MKTKILFLVLLFFLAIVNGQAKWGEWQSVSCFKGIFYKVGASKYGSKGDYQWSIKFKSTYNRKVHFNYSWNLSGDNFQENGPSNRITVQPNSQISNTGTERFIKNNKQTWRVEVDKVCFGETWASCGENGNRDMCYAECDNGSPNIPSKCSNNKSSGNSHNEDNNSTKDISEIYDTADEMPEFSGGINLFRQRVAENLDTSDLSGNGKVKTEVIFVIHENGNLSDVKAFGTNSRFDAEASRAVNSIKDKWNPAKLNGRNISYRFRMPFTMDFEAQKNSDNSNNSKIQNGSTSRYEGDYKVETNFHDGKVREVKATNIKTGKLIVQQFFDENEKPKEIITYYENGNKRSHAYFTDGKMNSYKENDGHGNFIDKPFPK